MQCVTLLLACVCAIVASPAARIKRDLTSLPETIPLELLFAACGDQTASTDIGPCVQQLLSGAIELAKPSFATGVDVGGKTRVLEPLSFKDVPAKPGRKFRFSMQHLQIHGISSVTVEDVTLQPDRLALDVSFEELRASADMMLRYSFITGNTNVELTLTQPRVRIEAGWVLDAADGSLKVKLIDPNVQLSIQALSTRITKLGGLGGLLQSILNNNDEVLLGILVPELERQAQEKLTNELDTIKLLN